MPTVSYCGKSLFYQEAGEGPVLLFLHGNTASSRLFEPLLPLHAPHFRCVLLDFLDNGRSDRAAVLPADLWQDEAPQGPGLTREAGEGRPRPPGAHRGGGGVALGGPAWWGPAAGAGPP